MRQRQIHEEREGVTKGTSCIYTPVQGMYYSNHDVYHRPESKPDHIQGDCRAQSTATHTVSVSPEYREKLTGGKVSAETLVELEREPHTSILRTFDLPVIQRYFPEYEKDHPQKIRLVNCPRKSSPP
jgi:hypothetical protein